MSGLDIYVAFLRAVNVGGNNKVSMADLRTCFQELGYGSVQTHGASGNVIFATAQADPRELEVRIERALAEGLSMPIRVLVRSFDEMKSVIEAIPGDWNDSRDRICDVMFLRHAIDRPQLVADLRPKPGIEQLVYQPGVLFWSVNRRDYGKSNVSKIVGTEVYREMTIRGPGTVRKVYELMSKLGDR